MYITLLRHAETSGNLKHQFIGKTDLPLDPKGILTAKKSIHYPDASKVYSSNLMRTIQTARILFPNAEIIEEKELREIDFGIFEGKSHEQLEKNKDYRDWIASDGWTSPSGGEKMSDFSNRCVKRFKQIIESELNNSEKNVFFVLHGGSIMAIMNEFESSSREFFFWRTGNCEGFLLETSDDTLCNKNSLHLIKRLT